MINNFDNGKLNSKIIILFLYYLAFIVFFKISFFGVSHLVKGNGELISTFYFLFFGIITFSLGCTIVLGFFYKSMTLNIITYRFSMINSIFLQFGISFSNGYLWIAVCVMIIENFKIKGIFNGIFEVHYTLIFLLMMFIIMIFTSSILFRFSSNLNNYLMDFYTDNYLSISSAQMKRLLSSTYAEKIYGIAVVLVTIMWLNNDNLSIKNSGDYFTSIFNADILVINISMSIYVNYSIVLLFKK